MTTPTVTIAVPAYNAEKTIRETLDTLLAQSYSSLELFVSDNHSTDATATIVREEYDSRGVALVTCPAPSPPKFDPLKVSLSALDNFNSMLGLGSGEYLAFYHADDRYDALIVERQVRFLESHPDAVAVFTNGKLINEQGEGLAVSLPQVVPLGEEGVFDLVQLLNAVMIHGSFLMTPTFMTRRAVLDHVGGMDKTREHAADYDWWFRIARHGSIGVIGDHLFFHRVSPTQDSRRGQIIYRTKPLPIFALLDEYLSVNVIRDQISPRAIRVNDSSRAWDALRIAENLLQDGDHREARRWLRVGLSRVASLQHLCIPKSVASMMRCTVLLAASAVGFGPKLARAEQWLLDERFRRTIKRKR